MNYEEGLKINELLRIIEHLKRMNNIKAIKLAKLVQKYINEDDYIQKIKLRIKINSYVYLIFIELLDNNSKNNIYNLGLDILEDCDNVEKDAGNGWMINTNGAFRYIMKDNEAILVNKIPRSYKSGFYLTDDSGKEAIDFSNKYKSILRIISNKMDRREETITYTKKPKNSKVSIEFLDEVIDYLNLPRINENKKEYKKEK